MKTLLLNIPNSLDGTSLYRAYGPLGHLANQLSEVKIMTSETFNWPVFSMVDGIFMQRPYSQNHFQIADMARCNNVPIWVDYDDDLFRVPISNPTHKTYGAQSTQKEIAKIIAMAEIVTVSTQQIKDNLSRLNPNIHVVPNALNEKIFNKRPSPPAARNPMMFWRGSPTHDKDLMYYTHEMAELAKKYPKFSWCFMGHPFWWTIEQMPTHNLILAEGVDPIEYFEVILKIAPAAVIVPLYDNDFNRTKSNIAWIEATYAGAVCIAPDWPEWQKPGVLLYDSTAEFKRLCELVIQGEINIQEKVKESWDYIQSSLTLKQINPMREKVIRELLKV